MTEYRSTRAFETEGASEPRGARAAAEAMREAAAKVADDAFFRGVRPTTTLENDYALGIMTVARDAANAIRALPLPDAPPDPRDAVLTRAHQALSAVSADDGTHASCRIKPETLEAVRDVIAAIGALALTKGAAPMKGADL